jgi:hypothetical protein
MFKITHNRVKLAMREIPANVVRKSVLTFCDISFILCNSSGLRLREFCQNFKKLWSFNCRELR